MGLTIYYSFENNSALQNVTTSPSPCPGQTLPPALNPPQPLSSESWSTTERQSVERQSVCFYSVRTSVLCRTSRIFSITFLNLFVFYHFRRLAFLPTRRSEWHLFILKSNQTVLQWFSPSPWKWCVRPASLDVTLSRIVFDENMIIIDIF